MPQEKEGFSLGGVIGGVLVFTVAAAWIYFHVCFCWRFLDFTEQWRFEEVKSDLYRLLPLNAAALLYVLLARATEGTSAERRFSLVGGFILSITPLGLAGLAFVATLPYFEQSLKEKLSEVDLEKYHSVVQSDIRIWLGLDISKSVLRTDGEVARGLCGLTANLLGVARGHDLGGRNDPLALSGISGLKLNSDASVSTSILEFAAETSGETALEVSNFSDPWPRQLSEEFCARMKALSKKGPGPLTASTDIVEFFEAVEGPATRSLRDGHRVVILLVSDLLHHVPDTDNSLSHIESRLRSVARNLRAAQSHGQTMCSKTSKTERKVACSQLAVVALLVPKPQQPSRDSIRETGPVDTGPALADLFREAWYKLDFHQMSEDGSFDDQLLLRGVLSTEIEVKVEETLFLRAPSGEQGRQPNLIKNILAPSHRNSEEVNFLAFRLRPWPDRGSLPDELNLSVEAAPEGPVFPAGGARDRQLLNSSVKKDETAWKYFAALPKFNMQAQVVLESHLDISKAGRVNLLVAVPKSLIVYRIPVVIVPYAGKGAQDIFALTVWLFMACVVIPCVVHLIDLYRMSSNLRGWVNKMPEATWPSVLLRRCGRVLLKTSWKTTAYLEDKFGKKGSHEAE